ncbi:MAG: hypothetical protein R3E77_10335 [Steroidobacteraceae bacterium]
MNESDTNRIRQLRERRMRVAEEKERAEKRAKRGGYVAAKASVALRTHLTLDAFDVDAKLPINFERKPNLAECPGLVAAHVSEKRARHIAECCDATIGPQAGRLGFDEYSYVGTASVASTNFTALLDAATSLHDSVLFCPNDSDSIVLIDYYNVGGLSRDVGFSIVIQGSQLEAKLAICFDNSVSLEGARAR